MFWRNKPEKRAAISVFTYDAAKQALIVNFTDGTSSVHYQVRPGFVVGLETAADKRAYYESDIASRFPMNQGEWAEITQAAAASQ